MNVMLAPPSKTCDQSSNSKALITKNWGIRITNAHQRRRINFLELIRKASDRKGEGQLRPREGMHGPIKARTGETGSAFGLFPTSTYTHRAGCFWLFMEEGVSEDKMAWVGWVRTQGHRVLCQGIWVSSPKHLRFFKGERQR